MEKIDCILIERIDMNFLKNQITDASIVGNFELKVKSKGISKTRDFIIDVEDPRWSQPSIFEHKGSQSLQVEISEGESRH
jgi:hypothetical protein